MRKACCLLLLSVLGGGASQQKKLDVTTFVVLGEGLAAGMADFSLRDVYQDKSFPAQMARQMKTIFPQPLIQSPGIGNVPGFPSLPVRVPTTLQTTVRTPFPPYLFVFNLSVPGFRVADSINRRPSPPLVQDRDAVQTSTNLILGFPALILGKGKPLWTQLEYARQMNPTIALVELGYYDVLEPAVKGDPSLLPDVAAFRTNYSTILATLKGLFAQVLVTTIPDPMDTAYFTSLSGATRLVGAPADVLAGLYKLHPSDRLTVNGLATIGSQLQVNETGTLPAGSVVSAATADQISKRVDALNSEITSLAQQNGAIVYDLRTFFRLMKASGIQVGSKTLTADYLGGFYSLDGFYPGNTGHALIANELLNLLNQTYKESFSLVDVNAVLNTDPAVRFTPAVKRPGKGSK